MSKELFENLRETEIIAQMSEEIYKQIPSELRQEMNLKSIEMKYLRLIANIFVMAMCLAIILIRYSIR